MDTNEEASHGNPNISSLLPVNSFPLSWPLLFLYSSGPHTMQMASNGLNPLKPWVQISLPLSKQFPLGIGHDYEILTNMSPHPQVKTLWLLLTMPGAYFILYQNRNLKETVTGSMLESFLLVCLFCFVFWDLSLYVTLAVLELVDQAGLQAQRSTCLCRPSIGIKGVCHCAQQYMLEYLIGLSKLHKACNQ